VGFGGCQDKDNVWWRLFQRLEQGIGGTGTEHMDFIYNVDLVTRLVWRIIYLLTEAPNIINTGIAGSVNLNNIQGSTFGY
jgi:hypothetical protein